MDLIDRSFIERFAQNIAATLNENTRDIFLAEISQDEIQRFSSIDQGLIGKTIDKDPGATREVARARYYDSQRLNRLTHATNGEPRIIGPDCLCTDENRVDLCPKSVRMLACRCTRDPARFAWRAYQSAIQAHPALCNNEGSPSYNPRVKGLVQGGALGVENVRSHFDSRVSQKFDPAARVTGIDVNRSNYDSLYAGPNNLIGASWGASRSGARLKRDVQNGTFRDGAAKITKTIHLGVRKPGLPMVTACDDLILNDEHGTDGGIWARAA